MAALYTMMDPDHASPDAGCTEYTRIAGLYDYPGCGTTANPKTVIPPFPPCGRYPSRFWVLGGAGAGQQRAIQAWRTH